MSEWIEDRLGRLASIEIGGTPSRDIPSFWGNENCIGYPWVSIADLGPRVISKTKEKITALGVRCSNVKAVQPGTMVMSFKLTIGRAGLAGMDLFTNEAIAAITSIGSKIDNMFLYYSLPPIAVNAVTDTAIKGKTLNKAKLAALRLRFPKNISEQRRIAEILSTVDEAIEQTEALIAKYQRIKAGLMHDLFTRGVTPDGRLRPPRDQAPNLYKQSPLGWIPQEWEATSIQDGSSLCIDCPHSTPVLSADGYIMARSSEIKNGEFFSALSPKVSKEEYYSRISRGMPQMGDVILTREAPVGEAFVIPPGIDICLGQRMVLIRFDRGVCLPEYFLHQIYSARARNAFDRLVGGTTNPHLNVEDVRRFKILKPKIDEQIRIAERLQSMRRSLISEQEELRKHQKIKQGLMHDLLTGRVPVKVPVSSKTEAAA